MLNTHYLIQLDTLFRDGQLTEGTAEFLQMMDEQGISYTILTEQSARTREQICEMLNEAGLADVRLEEIYTSSMAAVDYAFHHSSGRKAYVCGGRGIRSLLSQTGFEISYVSPEFIFFGLDRELMYSDYCDVLEMLEDGAQLLATDNRTVQMIDGRNRIGSAAIVSMMEAASGTKAVMFGRGSDLLLKWVLKYIRKTTADVTVVGNDFERDILPAALMGIRTVYVADNDEGAEAMMNSKIHPDFIVENPSGLTR